MSLNVLSTALWRERKLLDLLEFKLEGQQLLLSAGRSRWMTLTTQEIVAISEKLRTASLKCATASSVVAVTHGLDAAAPLSVVAQAMEEPEWREILEGHGTALRDSIARVTSLRDANVEELRAAQRPHQETLFTLDTHPRFQHALSHPAETQCSSAAYSSGAVAVLEKPAPDPRTEKTTLLEKEPAHLTSFPLDPVSEDVAREAALTATTDALPHSLMEYLR